jgi:hypothetical protein
MQDVLEPQAWAQIGPGPDRALPHQADTCPSVGQVPMGDPVALDAMRDRIRRRYPVERFAAARRQLDPKGILSNHIIDELLPPAEPLAAEAADR